MNTVGSHYIAVEYSPNWLNTYNVISNKTQNEQSSDRIMNPQKTPRNSPLGASHGASFRYSLSRRSHEILWAHCIKKPHDYLV